MMKYSFLIVVAVFMSGCGGGESTSSATAPVSTSSSIVTITMEINKTYNLHKGDTLKKTSDDAKVKITKVAQADTTGVLLLEGQAQITLKQ